MTRERWVENLTDAARGYNEPPETPRERMWQRIEAARAETRRDERPLPQAPPWWSRRQVLWPAAVVAALAIGLTIGRITGPVAETPTSVTPTVAAVSEAADDPAAVAATYRLAAVPVLQRSESLLLQLRTGSDSNSGSYTGRAASLLSQTRLLLQSPAADDPELAPLLRDLELALARIVQMAARPQPVDQVNPGRKTLEDGLERKAVLPRIRDLLATGPVVVGS